MFRRVAALLVVLAFCASAVAYDKPKQKLIAVTFDDGPRPYVLYGTKGPKVSPGLLDVLDQQQVKATFFVMGWRLTPKTWGDKRYETNIGVTCLDAIKIVQQRGHEVENHTYSHMELKTAARKKGLDWVVGDIVRGAETVKSATGRESKYLRPPDWILPADARKEVERRGYKVLTISQENPMEVRDVNSLDYLCAGANPKQCPKDGLSGAVLRQIEQREKKGVYSHVLAFHELTSTTAALPQLLSQLRARGYRFVTLQEYMQQVGK